MILEADILRRRLASRRRREIHDPALQRAAVLLLLFRHEGETQVLLTRRTDSVEHHKGQISLPGGAADSPGEESVTTALREAEEEVGLPGAACTILGLFDDFPTPSGFCVTPVVAAAADLPALRPNPHEVEEILSVPLRVFLDPSNERVEHRVSGATTTDVYFYSFGSHEIWGATASILRNFLRAALPGPERQDDHFPARDLNS